MYAVVGSHLQSEPAGRLFWHQSGQWSGDHRFEGLAAFINRNDAGGLGNDNPPFFVSAPAQLGFTPNGSQLVVTTKNNGLVDIFSVNRTGRLSDMPTESNVGGVPFAFTFDADADLALVNAGDNSLGTYHIAANGSLDVVAAPVSDGQTAVLDRVVVWFRLRREHRQRNDQLVPDHLGVARSRSSMRPRQRASRGRST